MSEPAIAARSTDAAPPVAATAADRPAERATPQVGEVAPDFTLADQNGRTVRLSEARGEKVILVFYRGYW